MAVLARLLAGVDVRSTAEASMRVAELISTGRGCEGSAEIRPDIFLSGSWDERPEKIRMDSSLRSERCW